MSRPGPAVTGPTTIVLDNRRVPCALGLIRLRETMATLPDDTVVVVLSRDQFAPIEIPLWAERAGHEILATEQTGTWPRRTHRITLRRRLLLSPGGDPTEVSPRRKQGSTQCR